MKIGFLGNANNGSFMVARQIRKLGHEVVFIVDSNSALNRPEGRYREVTLPYPDWIVDCSPMDIWGVDRSSMRIDRAIKLLRGCDAVVLNEFALALGGRIGRPLFALLTGTDIEVLADLRYPAFASGYVSGPFTDLFLHPRTWVARQRRRVFKHRLVRLVRAQRDAIRDASGFHYFPKGMLPNAERLFSEIGVDDSRRVFSLPAEIERYAYAPYPNNTKLRLFNVSRLQWRARSNAFGSELDNKGSDVLIRGLGLLVREDLIPIEVRLVRKGVDLEATQQLIDQEGISACVTWLDPMDQNALYDEYMNADIVSDHFGRGSIGMGAIDAMAVGRPVLANGSPAIFAAALGKAPPICHATTPEEVRDQLFRLSIDRGLRESIGKQSREYVEEYCDPMLVARSILSKLEHIA